MKKSKLRSSKFLKISHSASSCCGDFYLCSKRTREYFSSINHVYCRRLSTYRFHKLKFIKNEFQANFKYVLALLGVNLYVRVNLKSMNLRSKLRVSDIIAISAEINSYLSKIKNKPINQDLKSRLCTNSCSDLGASNKGSKYHFLILAIFLVLALLVYDAEIVRQQLLVDVNNDISLLKQAYKRDHCPSEIPALKIHCEEIEAKIDALKKQNVTAISVVFSWMFDSIKASIDRLGIWISLIIAAMIMYIFKKA